MSSSGVLVRDQERTCEVCRIKLDGKLQSLIQRSHERVSPSSAQSCRPGPIIDLTGWLWTGLIERISQDREELEMKRGQRPSAEQVVLTLRQIEVQTAQGKSIAVACKEADISEQSSQDECLKQEIFYSLKEAQVVIGLWQNTYNRVRPHSSLGLPTTRACHLPGSGLPPTHGCRHAVASQLARSKIPVRSELSMQNSS